MTGIAPLLFGLGLVALGFGVLSIVISILQAQAFATWIWGNFLAGAVLIAVAVSTSFDSLRERMSSGEGRRVGKYGTSAVLSTALGIVILGMLAWLSTRDELVRKWDWTEQKVHTLTQQTRDVLEGLERDVRVTAFFREIDQPGASDLLERYAYTSDRFHVEYADPNARPDLVQSLGVDTADLSRGLVHVALGEESVEVTDVDEVELTNALVKLTRTGTKQVYFLVGHNERAAEGDDADTAEGFARAAAALRNENYRTANLLLASLGEVPDDADVVVIPGPTRPFAAHETRALERFLGRGGALMALVDPRANTDLPEALATWGVELGDDMVIDPTMALFGSAMTPFGIDFDGSHPITEVLREDTPVLFHLARSVRVADADGASLDVIVRTGRDAWGESDVAGLERTGRVAFGPEDTKGPVALAVAGKPSLARPDGDGSPDAGDAEASESGEGRLVVVGDADFASNQYLDQAQNRDFFVNAVNWLLGDVESISIRPNKARASRFQMTNEQYQAIQYLSLFVLPEGIALLGVFAWWSRRRGGSGR